MEAYLGIDGGGTRTRALLVNERGAILGRGLAGPSNPQHYSEAELARTLREVMAQAFAGAGGEIELAAACYGLAGASPAEAQHRLSAIIETLPHQPKHGYCLQTDAHVAFAGAFAGGPGCLLILGTGSVCFGKDGRGTIHRTGGWGSIADDAGASGWIGKRAIETAVRQADGRAKGDALRQAVFAALGVPSPQALIPRLHDGPIRWQEIAALCPLVIDLAEQGDAPATEILNRALDEALALVRTTLDKLDPVPHAVAVSGGLPDSNQFFYDRLQAAVARALPQVQVQRPQLPSVAGAVLEAYRLHRKHMSPEMISRLNLELAQH